MQILVKYYRTYTIDDMNGPLAVANMIKTGNIAGMFTSVAYFIIIILAFLLSSMYGVKID